MKNYILLTISIFLSITVFAQANTQEKILKDIVVVNDGKYTATKLVLLTLPASMTKQLKIYVEAPMAGVVSRDWFVAIYQTLSQKMIDQELSSYGDLKALGQQETLNELIGNPDIEINIYMAKPGIQIEIKKDGKVDRTTKKWEDLHK